MLGRKAVSGIMLIVLLIGLLTLWFDVEMVKSKPSTTIYLDPSSCIFSADTVSVGYRFNVTVRVADVENLAAWQVCMFYDKSLIGVSRFFEPTWDSEYVFYGKSTLFLWDPEEPGELMLGACLFPGDQEKFYGSGKLCVIEFEILAVPPIGESYSCVLNINNEYTYLLDSNGNDIPAVKEDGYYEIRGIAPPPALPVVTTTVDINPQALNLRSRGRWITAYIELPQGYSVQDINVSTIMLNETILVEPKPITIGDYDNDSIPDLMVKFDRSKVIEYVMANVNMTKLFEERFMTVTLTITGYLNDGTPFEGSDTIKIIMPMPRGLFRIFPI